MTKPVNLLQRPTADQAGFSLVELAIVLLIVTLLLGGLLPTLSSQVEQRHNEETRKQLSEIQQALIGYAITNGRLPCPAKPSLATGTVGAGLPDGSPGACTSNPGIVPWAELGIPEADAWNRRFTYQVTPAFTNSTTLNLSTAGTLNVLTTSGGSNIATNVPAVIVSHGINGLGAYSATGLQLAGASGDELENADANTTYVSHEITPSFDDQVVWVSPNLLFNRMVSAGKLP